MTNVKLLLGFVGIYAEHWMRLSCSHYFSPGFVSHLSTRHCLEPVSINFFSQPRTSDESLINDTMHDLWLCSWRNVNFIPNIYTGGKQIQKFIYVLQFLWIFHNHISFLQ